MIIRLKWAFMEALHASRLFIFIVAAATVLLLLTENPTARLIAALLTAFPILVVATAVQHYCDMFDVVQVTDQGMGVTLEIGHASAFSDRFRFSTHGTELHIGHTHPVKFLHEPIHALMLDNGMLIIAPTAVALHLHHLVLPGNWNFYPLITKTQAKKLKQFWIEETPELVSTI